MLLRTIGALLLALTSTLASAAPPMLIATSPHFTIYAAQKEADLRRFAENLESYDAVLRRLTGGRADDADVVPLTIYMRADQTAVDAGWGTLGYYLPSAAGTLAVVPAKVRGIQLNSVPQIVLFHEYAHHFMLQNFPALYSPWFVEGAAEFYSTVEFAGDKALVGKPEPLRVGTLMGNQRTTLKYLLSPSKKGLTAQQTDELYARSWLLVHYLTLSAARSGQIDKYLSARGRGASEEQAFQTAFGTSIQAMDAELRRYFAPRSLSYATVDLPRAGAVSIRAASDGDVALARLVPELRNLQARKDALTAYKSSISARQAVELYSARLAADARSAARKMPGDAGVQEILAESLLLAGKPEEARAAADAAVKLKPGSARASGTGAGRACDAAARGRCRVIRDARPHRHRQSRRAERSVAAGGILPEFCRTRRQAATARDRRTGARASAGTAG